MGILAASANVMRAVVSYIHFLIVESELFTKNKCRSNTAMVPLSELYYLLYYHFSSDRKEATTSAGHTTEHGHQSSEVRRAR
jgi:hypothetical protein